MWFCPLQIGTCQGHLSFAWAEIESYAASATDLWPALKGVQGGEWGTMCSKETGRAGLCVVHSLDPIHSLWPHGCNTPDFLNLHHFSEFGQTHVHWISGYLFILCLQKQISWSQSLHLLTSRKALNPFMVASAPCDQQKTFCKVSTWFHWTPPSPKSYILTFPNCFFGAVSLLELSEVLSPGLQSSFCPK